MPWAYASLGSLSMAPKVSILVLVEVLPWVPVRCGLCLYPSRVSILVLVEVLPWARARRWGMMLLCDIHQFQSLFWWKYCPGNDCIHFQALFGSRFQSLFWWKYCPGSSPEEAFRWPYQGFNPCSGGSIALGIRERTCRPTARYRVSILVLVEVLPWEP